jgi:ribonuclease HII
VSLTFYSTVSAFKSSVLAFDSTVLIFYSASIIAKVTRDRIMVAHHETWPEYNFAQHKGYPTKSHMAAVFKHGACDQHRVTFAPLKHMTSAQLQYKPAA